MPAEGFVPVRTPARDARGGAVVFRRSFLNGPALFSAEGGRTREREYKNIRYF